MAAIVGRETELAAVQAFIVEAARRPAVFVLEGEPGSGKTTLWNHAVGVASQRGVATLTARPTEVETAFAYAGLADLLAPVLPDLTDLPLPRRHALDVALALADRDDEAVDQHAIAAATLASLTLLANDRPVLLAIDDVQWLDAPSLRAVAFALRRVAGVPFGALLATRDATRLLEALPTAGETTLGPLSLGAISSIVRARTRAEISRASMRRLHDAAGGNPLYALELANAQDSNRNQGSLTLPPSLEGLMRERIERLAATSLDACLAVALLAQPTEELIEAVLGEAAAEELEGAAAAGVLDLGGDRLRFTHPLLASAIIARASRRRRIELHRLLASLVPDAEQRARHLAAATQQPDAGIAAAVEAGARDAERRGAPEASAELFEAAARLTPPRSRDLALARTMAGADAHFVAGDTRRSRELLETALTAAESGPTRAEITRRLARARAFASFWSDAVALLEEALKNAGGDPGLTAAIENDIASSLSQYGDLAQAGRHAAAALTSATQSRDPGLLHDARLTLMTIDFQRGRADPDRAERFFATLREDLHPRASLLLQPHLDFIAWAKYTDRFSIARAAIRALVEELTAGGQEGLLAPVLFQGAELECWAGDLPAASKLARLMRAAHEQSGQPLMETRTLYVEGLIDAIRGDRRGACEAGARGLELAEGLGDRRLIIRHLTMLGLVELSHDDPAAANEHYGRADQVARLGGYGEPGMFRKDGDAIESLIRLGLLDAARERLTELEQRGRRLRRAWALAVAARSRALLALATGDTDDAVAFAEAALDEHRKVAQPIERARTLLALGEALRRNGRRSDARSALADARTLFTQVGAAAWTERAAAELHRVSGRTRRHGLTPAERRVAELVAAGKTNKEVAATLFLADRTVEGHLTHIYAKLGLRSRSELARRFRSD
jgi:DNA-binding CsgD family transcriptional regulator